MLIFDGCPSRRSWLALQAFRTDAQRRSIDDPAGVVQRSGSELAPSVLQSIKNGLRIHTEANRGDDQCTDSHAREAVYRNGVGIGIRLPVHRADNLEIIVESAADRDYTDNNQCNLALENGGVKDVKLAEESCGERQTRERNHSNQHREGEKWRTFCEAIEIGNFFASLLRHEGQSIRFVSALTRPSVSQQIQER